MLSTTADLDVAKRLARALVERRLIACANLVPAVTSIYRWQGRIEEGSEVLMIVKTSVARLEALEAAFHELHPYDTPEFVVVEPAHVAPRYLAWLMEETR